MHELNGIAAAFTAVAAILCAIFSDGRGSVSLTYVTNHTHVRTSPHMFDLGFVYVGTLTFSALFHGVVAVWPQRSIRDIRAGRHTDRLVMMGVLLPSLSVAAVVGIAGITEVYAVYAAASAGIVLTSSLWVAMSDSVHAIWRTVLVLLSVAFYASLWKFVWINAESYTYPIMLLAIATFVMLSTGALVWTKILSPIVRESIFVCMSVGIQLANGCIWVSIHHSPLSTSKPMTALASVMLVFIAMCTFVLFRLTGVMVAKVQETDDELLTEDLLPLDDRNVAYEIDDEMSESDVASDPDETDPSTTLVQM